MEHQYELDTRGLKAPIPVLRLKQAMAQIKKGEVLRLLSDDERSQTDVKAFAYHARHALLDAQVEGRDFVFLLEKG